MNVFSEFSECFSGPQKDGAIVTTGGSIWDDETNEQWITGVFLWRGRYYPAIIPTDGVAVIDYSVPWSESDNALHKAMKMAKVAAGDQTPIKLRP